MNEELIIFEGLILNENEFSVDGVKVTKELYFKIRNKCIEENEIIEQNHQLKDRIEKAIKLIEDDYYSLNTTNIDSIVVSGNKLVQLRKILKGEEQE